MAKSFLSLILFISIVPFKPTPQTDVAPQDAVSRGQTRYQVAVVSTPRKTKSDWFGLGIKAALAGVGFATLAFLWFQWREMARQRKTMQDTLIEIKRQADLMERQTLATEDTAEAALKQILPMKTKERALLIVGFDWEGFTVPSQWLLWEHPELAVAGFSVTISNVGMTTARNVALYGAVAVTPTEDFPPMSSARRILPFNPILKPETNPVVIDISVGNPFPKPEDGYRIEMGEAFLHLYGFVAFTDAFGDRNLHRFRWRWKSEGFEVEGQWQEMSGWVEVASPDDRDITEPTYFEHPS